MSSAKLESGETTQQGPAPVDYTAKARIFFLLRKGEKEEPDDGRKFLRWEGKEFGIYKGENMLPDERLRYPATEDLEAFLEKNREQLNHGDLLTTMTTDRASGIHIVSYNEESGKFEAILNPDEGGSGYLTIPATVLKNVTNAMEKYEEVLQNDDTQVLNMHISPKDDFITEKLGAKGPKSWQIDLHINEGEVEEAYVRLSDSGEWKDFDIEDSSIETIESLFDTGEEAKFAVVVELKDEKLNAYKAKYGNERAKYGWMHEKPSLPKKWKAEKGASSGGSTHMKWEWKFSGPTESEAAARKSVEAFLKDFTHWYKDDKPPKAD